MKIRSLVFTLLGIVLTAGCHRASQTPLVTSATPEPFTLVVERSPSGWAAKCDVGCRWKEVAMTCEACSIRLDVAGISDRDAARAGASGFAFVVSKTDAGLEAQGISGLAWKALTWGCTAGTCRARIDETGVSGG